MKRRSFLQVAAAQLAAAPLGLGALSACTPPPPLEWRDLALRAATHFPIDDLESARVVGARFLDGVGREEEQLEAELAPTLARLEAGAPIEDPETWRAAIRADFEAGETRDTGGWVFAATECHLAALVALFDVGPADLEV